MSRFTCGSTTPRGNGQRLTKSQRTRNGNEDDNGKGPCEEEGDKFSTGRGSEWGSW